MNKSEINPLEWVFPVSFRVQGNELIILQIIPNQEKCEYDRNNISDKA